MTARQEASLICWDGTVDSAREAEFSLYGYLWRYLRACISIDLACRSMILGLAIPFDELEIDQRFVHGAHIDATRCAAFDASLGLAKQLHMEAVAEGVEDRADWDFLKDKACDVAQGYFISKALPVGEIPSWLLSWEARRPELCQTEQVVH